MYNHQISGKIVKIYHNFKIFFLMFNFYLLKGSRPKNDEKNYTKVGFGYLI